MSSNPKINNAELLAEGKFLCLRRLHWADANGVPRLWETAERKNDFSAVLIVPRLEPSGRLVLIKQYRPPARGWVVEFPAGLLDEGEDAETGARRELREETGYVAGEVVVCPPSFTTPGMSNETVCFALARIDENIPENQNPETEFDPGEMIQTFLVKEDELMDFYQRESEKGVFFDSKLAMYILIRNA